MVAVPSAYFLTLDEQQILWMVIGVTAFLALATAFLDASVIALAGCFPLQVQSALQLGVGLSSLIGCVYRVVTKGLFPQTDRGIVVSSLVYFGAGALTIGFCMLALWLMTVHPFSKQCLDVREDVKEDDVDAERCDESTPTYDVFDERDPLLTLASSTRANTPFDDCEPLIDLPSIDTPLTPTDKRRVFLTTLKNGLCVTGLFLTTLSVWPALITELPARSVPWLGESGWWPLIMLNIFAITDVLGRFMAGWRFGVDRHTIWIPVVLRLALLPLLVANVGGWALSSDMWSIILVIALGWSNGWYDARGLVPLTPSVHTQYCVVTGAEVSQSF